MLATASPFPQYFDTDGSPLTGGAIYFGAANQNPETNPVTVYWDAAGTQPAAQPIDTLNGYAVRNGTPAIIYATGDYSITVRNRRNATVFYAGSSLIFNVGSQIYSDLASTSDASKSAGQVGHNYALNYAAGTVGAVLNDVCVNVKMFGAKLDNVTDDTAAFRSAALWLTDGRKLIIPAGTALITDEVIFTNSRIHIEGAGLGATKIRFQPGANKVCFRVENGSSVIYQGSIKGIGFYSNDTTYTKTAIQLIDHSGWVIEGCGTVYPHWYGAGSIFLNIKGREAGRIKDIYAFADRPLLCEAIPAPHTAAGIGLDHHNFHNMYLTSVGYPVVEFGTGLNVTQCSFTGHQAWVGGTYGLYWNDTTSSSTSEGLVLENIRWEQGTDPAKWLVYINHNYNLLGLSIKGGQGGDRNGIYLRKVSKVHFDGFAYTSATGVALDADTTVDDIEGTACFWQGGSTLNLPGHDLVFATPKNPNTGALPPTFSYCLTSNNAQMTAGRTYTATITRNSFTEVLGGGTITTTGKYTLIGKLCFFQITTVCAGGATIASTAGTSFYSGLPAVSTVGVLSTIRYDVATSLGNSSISGGGNATTPTWGATANATYITSGVYLTT